KCRSLACHAGPVYQPRLPNDTAPDSSRAFWMNDRTATTPAAAADEMSARSPRSMTVGAATSPARYTPMAVWKNVRTARMSAFCMMVSFLARRISPEINDLFDRQPLQEGAGVGSPQKLIGRVPGR